MRLEEELIIIQFGQGALSEEELLHQFAQLDEAGQGLRFNELLHLLEQLEPVVDEETTTEPEAPHTVIKSFSNRNRFIRRINVQDNTLHESYKLLLAQFKRDFQRQYAIENENPSSWWYWDFSKRDVVDRLLAGYRAVVNEVYSNLSFRGEFTSIAKLLHDDRMAKKALAEAPEPEGHHQYHFASYDEVIEKSIKSYGYAFNRPVWLLSNSLRKALVKQYGLDFDRANKVLWDVVDQHLREKYNDELLFSIH